MGKNGLDLMSACESGDLSTVLKVTNSLTEISACHENEVTALQVASAKGHVSIFTNSHLTKFAAPSVENKKKTCTWLVIPINNPLQIGCNNSFQGHRLFKLEP